MGIYPLPTSVGTNVIISRLYKPRQNFASIIPGSTAETPSWAQCYPADVWLKERLRTRKVKQKHDVYTLWNMKDDFSQWGVSDHWIQKYTRFMHDWITSKLYGWRLNHVCIKDFDTTAKSYQWAAYFNSQNKKDRNQPGISDSLKYNFLPIFSQPHLQNHRTRHSKMRLKPEIENKAFSMAKSRGVKNSLPNHKF